MKHEHHQDGEPPPRRGQSLPLLPFVHDLRQPLRAIVAAVQRIQRQQGPLSDEMKAQLSEIMGAATRQDYLIGSAVEYHSASETGLMEMGPRLPLMLAIQTACLKVEAFRREKGGTIRLPDHPTPAAAPAGLARVLEKVLHNALKFHPPGSSPEVGIELSDHGAEFVEIRITDNGVGIAPEYRESVLRPFSRLHPPSEFTGAGLGLSICARLLDTAGGGISIEAASHGARAPGTCVVIRYPTADPGA